MILNQHVALLDEGPSSQSAPPAVIKSYHDDADGEPMHHNMPVFSLIDLVDALSFLNHVKMDNDAIHGLSRCVTIQH